jgi:long-chain acyl-CoA synthetase
MAVVVGDKRKFACVLISPNFAALEEWARNNGISWASRADLITHAKVQGLYEELVERANEKLARFEKLKRVIVVPEEFTAENGVLTPTMKLRRRVVEERYRARIDEIYAQAEATTVI